MSPATLSLGPIIGKVTSSSARVLAESDAAATLTVDVKRNATVVASQTRAVAAKRIAAFAFQGLSPQTGYTVDVSGAQSLVSGSFRTLPTTPTVLRIGAVSCNREEVGAPWARLAAQIGSLDLLVHAGDQVYVDRHDTFEDALEIWQSKSPNASTDILELFRDRYRTLWAIPETRQVLASVPNLAIWDDHEIRNDFGTRPEDRDPASDAHGVGRLAWQVYREYQHSLFEDPPAGPPAGFEYHAHAFGPIGLVFLDLRSARTFAPGPPIPPSRPYLGNVQWMRLRADLQSGPLAAIRALLVVSPTPPVLLNPVLSFLLAPFERSLLDQWAYAPYRAEQRALLELLRDWKSGGAREVFVLAGDLHLGVQQTTIRHGSVEFRQMISSAINTRSDSTEFQVVKLALWLHRFPGWGFRVKHSGFEQRKNFGIIQIDAPPLAPPTVTASLVAAE